MEEHLQLEGDIEGRLAQGSAAMAAEGAAASPAGLPAQLGEGPLSAEGRDQGRLVGELGERSDPNWCGLVQRRDGTGGHILLRNPHGTHWTWTTSSDDALHQQWRALAREHDAYRRCVLPDRGDEADNDSETDDGDACRERHLAVRIISVADAERGQDYGAWFDATRDPADLRSAARFLLRHGYTADANEWAIEQYGPGFCDLRLDHPVALGVLSLVARGIAEHGEAFAHWALHVGVARERDLRSFTERYCGRFPDINAYVTELLADVGVANYRWQLPDVIRPYATFDTTRMAEDLQKRLYITSASNGGIHVFAPP